MNGKYYMALEVGGKKRGMKFDLGAKEIAAELFKEPESASSDLKSATIIMFATMTSVCEIKEEEPDFTIDDVRKWARRLDNDDVAQIVEMWNKAYVSKGSTTPAEGNGVQDTQHQTA